MNSREIWKPCHIQGYEVSNTYKVRRASDMKLIPYSDRHRRRVRLNVKGRTVAFLVSELVEPVFNPIPGL